MLDKKSEIIGKYYDEYFEMYSIWSGKAEGATHLGAANKFSDIFNNGKMILNASEKLVKSLDINLDKESYRILDAGCGAGHVSRVLAEKFLKNKYNNFKIYGVDLSDKQLERNEELNKKKNLNKKIILKKESYEKLSFGDGFFDIIFFVESICCGEAEDKEKALKEVYRVLKPGGLLVVQDGFLEFNPKNRLMKKVNEALNREWRVDKWSRDDLFKRRLNKLGFLDIKEEKLFFGVGFSVLYLLPIKLPIAIYYYIMNKVDFRVVVGFLRIGLFVPIIGLYPGFNYKIIKTIKK